MSATPPFLLTSTERVYMGNRIEEALVAELDHLGAKRVFVLIGSTLRHRTDVGERVTNALGERMAAMYDGIRPHGPRSDILAAADAARQADADLIVAVGGGSVTDAGKLIPIILKHNLRQHDDMDAYHVYVDENGEVHHPVFDAPDIRTICCPTTLSGGEFNPLSGATNEKVGQKFGTEHRMAAPVSVILDPSITVYTPEWLWFSTGIRAVDHALEALGSFASNAYADGVADSALRLLSRAMPAVKADPTDLGARLDCQIGAWQSMVPILGGVPMGASHAIGHILGGTCDVPHGYCSCVMAPSVLAFNEPVNGERQQRIIACMGGDEPASVQVDRFIRSLGMPRSLTAVNVSVDQLDHIAAYTMNDFWARTNPRPIREAADVRQILELALTDD